LRSLKNYRDSILDHLSATNEWSIP